jgi:gluconolactonase
MIFAENLGVPEGPVVLDDGSWLVVEMGPERGCVTQLDQDGHLGRVIARTGRPNGLAVDRDGTIWVAESREPSLIRLGMDGRVYRIDPGTSEIEKLDSGLRFTNGR